MNITRLLEVKAAILNHPGGTDMRGWHSFDGETHCIGGWVEALWDWRSYEPKYDMNSGRSFAETVLDLTDFQANRLFYVENWPVAYAKAYEEAERDSESTV